MITASDQIDMMKRMMTTQRARPAHVAPELHDGLKPTCGLLEEHGEGSGNVSECVAR